MRRLTWMSAAAGVLCLTISLADAAERDTYQSAKDAAAESKAKAEAKKKETARSWWWPFGSSAKAEPKPEAKETVKADKPEQTAKAAKPKPITAPLGLEGANLIADEQAKFLRRQQVCDRIREAALSKGDTSLEKQAQLLEQRAWFIYEQRTAQARMPSMLPLEDNLDARKLTAEPTLKSRRAGETSVHSIYAKSPVKTGTEE
jgi:hypothetical protein